MKLKLQRLGGLASIQRPPLEVDTDALEPNLASEIRAGVEAAQFFELPSDIGTDEPDGTGYDLEVESDGRKRSVALTLPSASPALQKLVGLVKQTSSTIAAKPVSLKEAEPLVQSEKKG